MRLIQVLFITLILSVGVGVVQAKDLKVGFVYNSSVGDKGYSYAHEMGRLAVEKMDGVETTYVEGVTEGPDSERVVLNMARRGYDVIFTTSYGYIDFVHRVAPQYPDIKFLQCASDTRIAENVNNYFGRMYQARYLSGMVAGSMTESDTIGFVAAFPIPEVVRGINAFTLGVRAVNPDAEVRVVWTRTWYDPTIEKEAAKSLLDVGADVIAQHQNSPGPQEAAQEAGAYSIGYNADMSDFAPSAHLTSAVWNWASYYGHALQEIQGGSWEARADWPGMETGIVGLAPYGDMVPQQVRDLVDSRQKEIINGDFVVFAGPLKDQSGQVKVESGASLSDEEKLSIMWFVEGVVGTTN